MAASIIKTEHADSASKVKLGFVEEVDSRLLSSHFFPSKVGGKPAWLSFDPLPEPESVKCGKCGGPTVFLMQVYAPLKTNDTFHRSLFIFVCSRDTCTKEDETQNFTVLRSQLPLKNTFYSEDPPDENLESEEGEEDCSSFPHDANHYHNLCHVCGVKSLKKCAKCKEVYYCSKEHQTADWKCKHKTICGGNAQAEDPKKGGDHVHELLFKEYDLVTEEEELESRERKTDEERMEDYKVMMQALKMKSVSGSGQFKEGELDKAATGETEDDKHFLSFKKRIDIEPTQVLRYCRGGEPLWVSAFHKPTPNNIPNCDCGAKRIFEFQVMPQLLNYLKVEILDWGTLCVYTCAESCRIGNAYHQEFLWKQDFHNGKDSNELGK